MSTLLNAMRRAIESGPKTRYRLSKETGIGESQLAKVMSGKAGLSIERAELLADALGLEITVRPKRHKGK